MQLQPIHWIIIFTSLAICFVPALFYGKRAGKSTSEFFVSGRAVPWWLAGLSMVATTFSSDTPNLVTDIVRRNGVAGNWVWWAFVLTGVSTVFFYARLWRRSGVMTDLEFYEIRYSGGAARGLRGFRAIYLGLLFNCMIMATVNLAAVKIASVLFGLERWQTLVGVGLLNVVFAAHSGLWGVLVIDMIQFFIKMSAVIAAAYFAVTAPEVGGLEALISKLSNMTGPGGVHYLNILPDFTSNWDLAVAVFIMPIAVQWWAVWYPGAEPGGGSYVAQRMLASKSERDALGAVLFFNVAHYVLRPWPWILVALASIVVYPELSDIQRALPHVDPGLIGHDIAYPAMLKFLPAGFIGLMVGGLIAANSSTILTHLNWGAPTWCTTSIAASCTATAPKRTTCWRTGGDGSALRLCVGNRLPARHGEGRVRHHPPGGGRYRTALSGSLVLVAGECLVRDRRDDQLVRDLGRAPRTRPQRHRHHHARCPPDDDCGHHGQLAAGRVLRTRDRPRGAEVVLPQGAAIGTGLGTHSRRGRTVARR